MTSRGLRNNNPFNLERNATVWQGMAADQSSDPRFIVFKTPEFGIRGGFKTVLTYQLHDGCKTLRQVINRFAPPVENNTSAYIAAICAAVEVGPDEEVNLDTMALALPFAKGVILHENGENPYSDTLITEGLRMAGVSDAKSPPLMSQPHVVAQAGGAGALGIAGAVQYGSQLLQGSGAVAHTVKDWATQLGDFSSVPIAQEAIQALLTVGFGLTTLSIAYTAYKHFRSI